MVTFMLLLFSGQIIATSTLLSIVFFLTKKPHQESTLCSLVKTDEEFGNSLEREPIASYRK